MEKTYEDGLKESALKARSIFWLGKSSNKTDEEIAQDFENYMRDVGVVFEENNYLI